MLGALSDAPDLLGGQFLDAAELAIGAILDALERWIILEAGVRRYPMPRFPFEVYFRVWPDHLRILVFKLPHQ